jgi:phenylacetate-CoA ligase
MWPEMDRPYWNEEIETMPLEKLRKLESERLQKQMAYVYRTSPWYAEKFDQAGVRPDSIRDYKDLARLPFTNKTDLTRSQDDGSLVGVNQCAPQDDILRIVGTGGTTGRPLRLPFTANDITVYAEQGARSLWAMGCRPTDTVINVFNYSIYAGGVTGGNSFEYLGATTLPYSVGQTARLFDLLGHLQGTLGLYATPSYAVRLLDRADEEGVDLRALGVKKAFLSGEAGLQIPGYRERIEDGWGMQARDLYGAAEVGAHSAECEHLNGLHWFGSGLVIAELIDPQSLDVIEMHEGAVGELVFTSIQREAGPLVRLRTHDLVEVFTDPCPCGRTSFRFLTRARSDDMFVVKGINVYPLGVQSVLAGLRPRITGEYRIILRAAPPIDYEPELHVEISREVPEAEVASVLAEVREAIRGRLSFTPEVHPVAQGVIASDHKTRRVYRAYDGILPAD